MALSAQQVKLFAVGGVLGLAVTYLILTSMSTTAVYYLTVAELAERGARAENQMVRVSGTVAPGTIVRENGGLDLRFTMQDDSGRLPVVYRGGTVPDIFSEHVQVVVEGKLQPDGTFAASTLLAKCPSRFEDGNQPSVASEGLGLSGAKGPQYETADASLSSAWQGR